MGWTAGGGHGTLDLGRFDCLIWQAAGSNGPPVCRDLPPVIRYPMDDPRVRLLLISGGDGRLSMALISGFCGCRISWIFRCPPMEFSESVAIADLETTLAARDVDDNGA
ncbi:hypothetical protein ACLOJK_004849 [Asimina triloba]